MYNPNDLRYIFFVGDHNELASCKGSTIKRKNLEDFLNVIPSYQFLPSFRGDPKPDVFLHKFKTKVGNTVYYCHSGLSKTVFDWCQANKIQISQQVLQPIPSASFGNAGRNRGEKHFPGGFHKVRNHFGHNV